MFSNIINATLHLTDFTMDYIRFGRGAKTLVMLPGLGDGLTTVKGTALPMAYMYRLFAKHYTVYMFSRRSSLPDSFSTRDMAHDLCIALKALGIKRCDLLGVSMGGMIAQHFAADFPSTVHKLVLAVTSAAPNETLTSSISEWLALASKGNLTAFLDSNMRHMYSPSYYRRSRWLIPLIACFTRPKTYQRFTAQANACITHNALERLPFIQAQTLIIGGEQDHALSPDASRQICDAIPGARIKMYPEWGHALYEEAKDFNQTVLQFLLDN